MNIRIILHIIGIAFVLGKVFGQPPVAGWSWLWVLAPFWGPLALAALFVFGYLSFHLPLYKFNKSYRENYDRRKAFEAMAEALKGVR